LLDGLRAQLLYRALDLETVDFDCFILNVELRRVGVGILTFRYRRTQGEQMIRLDPFRSPLPIIVSLHEVPKFVERSCFYLRKLAVSFFLSISI